MTMPDQFRTEDFSRKHIGKLTFLFALSLFNFCLSLAKHDWGHFFMTLPLFSLLSGVMYHEFVCGSRGVRALRGLMSARQHEAVIGILAYPWDRFCGRCIVLGIVLKIAF